MHALASILTTWTLRILVLIYVKFDGGELGADHVNGLIIDDLDLTN